MILNKKNYILLVIVSISLTIGITALYGHTVDQTSYEDDDYYDENRLRYSNHVYKDNIQTPVAHRVNEPLSLPIIKLNSDERIEFYFDELGDDYGNYSYTVIHCTHDWTPSDMMPSEYIDGFAENQITDYANSFNTFTNYANYRVELPNDDIAMTKSGNYILFVYENADQKQPVMTYRFVVYEPLTSIDINVDRPSDVDDMNYKQEVDFTIDHGALYVSDPFREIHVSVLQNGRWDNAITHLQPQFIQNSKLVYDYNDEGTFNGNNEFRYLDLKSAEFRGEKILNIDLDSGMYVYDFKVETKRSYLQYLYSRDINGKFIIKEENDLNSHTDADYVKVKLSLESYEPIEEGSVYLYGGISMWEIKDALKMDYLPESHKYYIEFIIKQGYYNFMFGVPDATGNVNTTLLEGTHFETENDYQILVYQTVFSESYDRVVGYGLVNTAR